MRSQTPLRLFNTCTTLRYSLFLVPILFTICHISSLVPGRFVSSKGAKTDCKSFKLSEPLCALLCCYSEVRLSKDPNIVAPLASLFCWRLGLRPASCLDWSVINPLWPAASTQLLHWDQTHLSHWTKGRQSAGNCCCYLIISFYSDGGFSDLLRTVKGFFDMKIKFTAIWRVFHCKEYRAKIKI